MDVVVNQGERVGFPTLDALLANPDILLGKRYNEKLDCDRLIIFEYYTDLLAKNTGTRKFYDTQYGSHSTNRVDKRYVDIARIIRNPRANDYVCENGMHVSLINNSMITGKESSKFDLFGQHNSEANFLVSEMMKFRDMYHTNNILFSNLRPAIGKAFSNSFDAERITPGFPMGWREVTLRDKAIDLWSRDGIIEISEFRKLYPEERAFHENEFVLFKIEGDDALFETVRNKGYGYYIGRYESDFQYIRRIHYIDELPKGFELRSPRQAMLAEAILAPEDEICEVLVSAPAGSGKTYLSAGLAALGTFLDKNKERYEKITASTSDSNSGRQQGFLPGELINKFAPDLEPFFENMTQAIMNLGYKTKNGALKTRNMIRAELMEMCKPPEEAPQSHLAGKIEIAPTYYLRGRTLINTLFFFDEAQENTPQQASLIVTRVGNGSKGIITSDIKQTYLEDSSRYNNGQSFIMNALKNTPGVCVLSMLREDSVRNPFMDGILKALSS